jgi:hypothetical protein
LVSSKFGFTTTPGKMMATEPGKATPDKEIKPVVDGSQTDMKPIGNVAKGVAMMNAQEAFGDFEKA